MTSGNHTYESEHGIDFEIDWVAPGDPPENHDRLLDALGEEVAPLLRAALEVGKHWKLEDVRLRLGFWTKPSCIVWLTGPPGYLDEDSDEPDAAEKVAQRKEFYRNHNQVHDTRIIVDGRPYEVKIDVRQF